jgi:hypothetical protein
MSKMITNLATTVLYEADKKVDQLITYHGNVVLQELTKARSPSAPTALLLTESGRTSVINDLSTYGQLCALQTYIRQWYAGAPEVMETVPEYTVPLLQALDDSVTWLQIEAAVFALSDKVFDKCPNWTYGTPPVEAEVLPPSEVDATADADIPHTTDTGEDA